MTKLLVSITLMLVCALMPVSACCGTKTLPPGLWEGVSESDYSYKLLQINENGEHFLFEAGIGNGFRHIRRIPFGNGDIECSALNCEITLQNYEDGHDKHLILSPSIDTHYKVLESTTDKNNKPILSSTYQLDKQNNQSSVRNFMDEYRNSIIALANTATGDIYGLWVGIMRIDDKDELISIEIYPKQEGRLVRFINGSSYTNQTSFKPEDIHKEGSVYTVKTSHPTFANSLLFTIPVSDVLNGYAYSVYKDQPLENMTFTLYRIRN
ncbi:hypothetical protein Q4561_14370 [Alteromonas sp. 1_MG-2023]|uniref:hypothetical protein n=1 Tax=Alteromonas sp. 1_MG-2023 TaxID=3062669 RepID=UPI0026E2666A|nr:hypothetical protein [Alteromonas sp. 1_MG-2023]MDO6568254.1 hypothetical protein [Alteromonas sp. 1_MG-2023]